MSEAEETLALHLRANGIEFVREYRFAAEHVGLACRLCVLTHKLLIEVEGGGWIGGRHTRGAGFESDLMKYDAAKRLGYSVYRCSPVMVKNGRAIETIQELLKLQREDKS